MARKIHLRANKAIDTAAYSICAAKRVSDGVVKRNSRKTYAFMASEIVSFAEFKQVASEDRCAHCVEAGLVQRNYQRKAKGLSPVASLFD